MLKKAFNQFNQPATRQAFDEFNKEDVRLAFSEFNKAEVKKAFNEFNKTETREAFDEFNKEDVRLAFNEFNKEDIQLAFNEFNKEDVKKAFNEFNQEETRKAFDEFNKEETKRAFAEFKDPNSDYNKVYVAKTTEFGATYFDDLAESVDQLEAQQKILSAQNEELSFAASYGKVPASFNQIQRLANQNKLEEARQQLEGFEKDDTIKSQYRNGWLTRHFRKKLDVQFPNAMSQTMEALGGGVISDVIPLAQTGEAIAIGSQGDQVQIWKLSPDSAPVAIEGLELPTLGQGRVVAAAVSPNEKLIALALANVSEDSDPIWVINLEDKTHLKLNSREINLRGLGDAVPLAVQNRCESLAFVGNELLVTVDELRGDTDPSDRLRVTLRSITGNEVSDQQFKPVKIGATAAIPGRPIAHLSDILKSDGKALVALAFESLDERGVRTSKLAMIEILANGQTKSLGQRTIGLLPSAIDVAPNGGILCGFGNGSLEQYSMSNLNSDDAKPTYLGNVNENKIVRLESSPAGFAISGSEDGKLALWQFTEAIEALDESESDTAGGKWRHLKTLTGQPAELSSLRLGPVDPVKGLTVFSGDVQGNVRYWEPETGVHDSVVDKSVPIVNKESARTVTSAAVDQAKGQAEFPAHAYGLNNGSIVYYDSDAIKTKGSGRMIGAPDRDSVSLQGTPNPFDGRIRPKFTIRSPFARFDSTFQEFDAMGIVANQFFVLKEDGTFFHTLIGGNESKPSYQSRTLDLMPKMGMERPDRKFMPLVASSVDKDYFFSSNPAQPGNLLWWTYQDDKFRCQPISLGLKFAEVKQLKMSDDGNWLAVVRRVGQEGELEKNDIDRPKLRSDEYHPNDYLTEIYRIEDGTTGKLSFMDKSRFSYSVYDPAFVGFSPDSENLVVQFHKKGVDRQTWLDIWTLKNGEWNKSENPELLNEENKVFVVDWAPTGKSQFITRKSRELIKAVRRDKFGVRGQAFDLQMADGSTILDAKGFKDKGLVEKVVKVIRQMFEQGQALQLGTLKKYRTELISVLSNETITNDDGLTDQIKALIKTIDKEVRERSPRTIRYSGGDSEFYVLYPSRLELESGSTSRAAMDQFSNARDLRVFGDRAVVLDDWGFHLVTRNGDVTRLAPRSSQVIDMSLADGILASIYGGPGEVSGLGIIRDVRSERPKVLGRITDCRKVLMSSDGVYAAVLRGEELQLFATGQGFDTPIMTDLAGQHAAMQWIDGKLLLANSDTGALKWSLFDPANQTKADPNAPDAEAWAKSFVSVAYALEGKTLGAKVVLPTKIDGNLTSFELAPITKRYIGIGSTSGRGFSLWSTYDEAQEIMDTANPMVAGNAKVRSFSLSEFSNSDWKISEVGSSLAIVSETPTDEGVESSLGFFVLASSEGANVDSFAGLEYRALPIGGALETTTTDSNPLIDSSEVLGLKFSGDGRTLIQINANGIKSFLSQ